MLRIGLNLQLGALLLAHILACSSDSTTSTQPEGIAGGAAGAAGSVTSSAGSSGAVSSAGGNGGSAPMVQNCTSPSVGAAPLRRLTREQYDNTLRDLLSVSGKPSAALSPDEKVAAFYSNAISPMTRLGVEQYGEIAEGVARAAVTNLDALVACDRAVRGDGACATQFITDFGLRAFRRPLSAAEVARYQELYDAHSAPGFGEGIRLVLQGMLQSPHFLYHLELSPAPAGVGSVPLNGYQVASRLSYALWNTTPDPVLLDAARNGDLDSKEGVLTQAMRLLAEDRARDALASFHVQWLGLENLIDSQKDAALFPEFNEELKSAMSAETVAFADYVIRSGDGRLETLLSAPFTVAEGPLLNLYGAASAAASTVALNPSERAGLFTQAAFLAAQAHPNQTSPVHRGLTIRKSLLCTTLPDPPANVNNTPPNPAPDATTRERFAEHTADPSCAGCHLLIDPIGFGFENYDAIGRYRTQENGLAIDASGELTGAGTTSGPFVGAVELAHRLATSEEVRACFQKQWFRFSLGRSESTEDACTLADIGAQFAASDYNVKSLLLALVSSDAFRFRKGNQ